MYNLKSLLLNILILISFFFLSSAFCQNFDSNKKGTRTIYLIRHGDYNQTDEQDEFIGNELTPLGIAQARLLASRLKAMTVAVYFAHKQHNDTCKTNCDDSESRNSLKLQLKQD